RSELVLLFFEQVRVDRARTDAVSIGERGNRGRAGESVREVPQHVKGERRACARQAMYFAGIAEFFLDGCGGGGLQELSKPGAGVGKSPGRQLDPERVERFGDPIGDVGHDGQSSDSGAASAAARIAQ